MYYTARCQKTPSNVNTRKLGWGKGSLLHGPSCEATRSSES